MHSYLAPTQTYSIHDMYYLLSSDIITPHLHLNVFCQLIFCVCEFMKLLHSILKTVRDGI